MIGKTLAAIFKLSEVTVRLGFALDAAGVSADIVQIGLGRAKYGVCPQG
jgi:hypothetical protein